MAEYGIPFYLEVVGAARLNIDGRLTKPPNTYVTVQVDNFTARTKLVKRTSSPTWNKEFKFTARLSSMLRFQAKHQPNIVRPRQMLGVLEIRISELLDMCKDQRDVILKLAGPSSTDHLDRGEITIRFRTEEPAKASALAITEAKQAVDAKLKSEGSAMKLMEAVILKLKVLSEVMDEAANLHPYINVVWTVLSSVHKVMKNQLERDGRVIDLMVAMEHVYSFVDEIQSIPDKVKSLEKVIKTILQQTFECAIFIQDYSGLGFAKRVLKQTFLDGASNQIAKFTESFIQLKDDFDSGICIQSALVSSRMFDRVETIARQQNLFMLQPAAMNRYGRSACLPGTRVNVLNLVTDWLIDGSGNQNIFWLQGVAGSGKSCLSTTLANLFEENNRLGAFLFFNRNVAEQCDPRLVIQTLAFKLATFDRRIGNVISAVVENHTAIVDSDIHFQFNKLLVEPISSLDGLQYEGPIVIVLDALDECGSIEHRTALLRVLAMESANLPAFLRIIVTSRPESDIQYYFGDQRNTLSHRLDVNSEDTQNDIEIYIRHQMAEVVAKNKLLGLSDDWPHDHIYTLIQRASGLFIWASTACKFIDAYDPKQQLSILLQAKDMSKAESPLDRLYITALKSAGDWTDTNFSADFRVIMGAVLVAKNPLTVAALNELLTFSRPPMHAISRLGCVLYANPIIHILHPSFADFLSNQTRCKYDMWFIDLVSHNFYFTVHCLDHLDVFLRYNMCNLKHSQSVCVADASLSEGVSYACIFWVEHVCMIKDAISIADRLETFLFKHLLHWFEAMAILKKSKDTIGILRHLQDWHMNVLPNNFKLQELINDACRFAQTFICVIEHHPLQVYMSALPFTPINTTLYHHFHNISQNPQIVIGADTSWSRLLLTFSNIKMCHHLSFSHDGKQVLSGTMDGTFYIHDTITGAPILVAPVQNQHFNIPQDLHRCCAFAPDSSWVVSVLTEDIQLDDCFTQLSTQQLQLWDSLSGARIQDPILVSRSSIPIQDLVVSPDGALIACCSKTTLYAFQVQSGEKVFSSTLYPEISIIRLLAFCLDSTQIISASYNGHIYCWDSTTGVKVLGPFSGHQRVVLDIVSDGKQILSVDDGGNVHIWDALSGGIIHTLSLQGVQEHGYPTPGKVAFSPDGQQLAVCTGKGHTGVWDSCSGMETQVITLVESWNSWTALAWSPDGKAIVSGKHDSIRLWDATVSATSETLDSRKLVPYTYSSDGSQIAFSDKKNSIPSIIVLDAMSGAELCTLRGHSKSIPSVNFCPNGSHIVSGSHDWTIRVWDIMTGSEIYALTEGHTDSINSVAYCPEGRRIVSASNDCTIRVWNTISQTTILHLRDTHQFNYAAFSPNGTQIVSHSGLDNVRVWDAASGAQILGPLVVPGNCPEPPVTFSPDGTMIGCSLSDDSWNDFDRWHQWSAITGIAVDGALLPMVLGCTPFDRFVIEKADMSIKDTITGFTLCWLPPLDINKTASSQTSIVLTMDTGIIVLHFPPWMLSN